VQYVWDPKKAAANIKKHGVTFEEAVSVFDDADALQESDTARGEYRINVTGWSTRGRMLFVVAVEITGDLVRIISARKANHAEQSTYYDR
jgi:uncharacterized DUF497 family protein